MDPAAPPLAVVPYATYRVQLHAGFGFAAAAALIPHLLALGVSHLYVSPVLKARRGSTHGYDVVDFETPNPELGGEAGFDAMADALAAAGLGLVLDLVPNHMGVIEADNDWWLDVLENGPAAAHAPAFDIEWSPSQKELHGRVLLPVLGGPYGEALEAGQLVPVFEPARGGFVVRYFGHRFPIDPSDGASLLAEAPLPAAATEPERATVASLLDGFGRLPPRTTVDAVERATRQREASGLRAALARLHAEAAWAPAWLDDCAGAFRGTPGDARSFDALDALLQRQAYRLAHWRAAGDELNYRRFFDIDALAALRQQEPAVFEASHRRVLGWVAQRRVDGLRIDHPDGMADPAAYFERLRRRAVEARGDGRAPWTVVEKILGDDEPWPAAWAVDGDTGYRFSNQANGLFVDGANEAAFDALYAAHVGAPVDYRAELDAAKRSIMSTALAADLRLLTEWAHDLALGDRHTRDLTREGLQAAIVDVAAAFDVYRSYVDERGVPAADRARIEKAAAAARARCRPSRAPYVDFVRRLLLEPIESPARRAQQLRFVQRLQQFTAPVMAKAMEDTAFYRYHRLVSLNDVGGDPRRFGVDVASFHAANALRAKETPATMLATSTHDSKRSEDVRARLDVLSEMPDRWAAAVERWRDLARTQWRIGGLVDEDWPLPNDELLLWQTIVGAWDDDLADDAALGAFRGRVGAYMLKAVREAKQRSSWLDADDAYERALQRAVEVLLARIEPNPLLSDLRRFVAEIAPFGCVNSLALVALKATSPGVPDFYEGCEDWRFSLVDPDNRRPLDRDALGRRLAAAIAADPQRLAREPLPGGLHKLALTARLLAFRRDAEALFRDGDYRPLDAEGAKREHVVAFMRSLGDDVAVTVVPRLAHRLADGDAGTLASGGCWGDTTVALPDGAPTSWVDVVGGRRCEAVGDRIALGGLLEGLPVAVLRPAA